MPLDSGFEVVQRSSDMLPGTAECEDKIECSMSLLERFEGVGPGDSGANGIGERGGFADKGRCFGFRLGCATGFGAAILGLGGDCGSACS